MLLISKSGRAVSYVFAIGALAVGCASQSGKPQADTSTGPQAKSYAEQKDSAAIDEAATQKVNGRDFVEVEFATQSSRLSEKAKSAVRALVEEAAAQGQIADVLVLAWADDEYPSKQVKRLPKQQVDLAAQRAQSLKNYIESVRTVDVEKYNLAKRPNTFAKWFNTTDARLKNTLVAAGLPTSSDEIQYPSKASHSVVIVKLK